MQPHMLEDEADDYSVSRSLEAYLLWLFGSIMFTNTHGNCTDKVLIQYAQEIVDSDPDDDVPRYSWGSAVLAATYHGLCESCMKVDDNGILTGCPILLQLWSCERLAIGRPTVCLDPYGAELYEDDIADSQPTFGTLWLRRSVRSRSFISFTISLIYSMHCFLAVLIDVKLPFAEILGSCTDQTLLSGVRT